MLPAAEGILAVVNNGMSSKAVIRFSGRRRKVRWARQVGDTAPTMTQL